MVQQYQSPVRVYKYPFELVMAAYERRFPTCSMIPIFLGSDTVSEFRSPDGAVHIIERRCRLNVDAPYLLKKIIGVDYVLFVQKNTLDLRQRTLKIEARNESFANRVAIDELCTYYVHPENSNWTCFEQSGTLDVKSFFGFESSIEKLAVKQYSQNIAKGKEIIEHFVAQLREEGITHVPIFQEAESPSFDEENGNQLSDVTSEDSRERSCSQESSNFSEDLQLGSTALTLQHVMEKLTLHDGQYQLDSDYIQRYVGNLSPLQESRLVQLRKCVAELHKGKVPSDTTLLRFLRARNFHVEKAREMLCQSLVWRKKHQVDKLLAEYELPLVVKDYFPGSWHFTDIDGRPLFLLRVGHMDVKGLVKSIGEEGLLKLTLHFCEEGLRLCEEATTASGNPVSTWTLLVDLDGLNMRHLWRPGVQTLLRIIEVMEANYPETLSRILITRAPRVFPILWTVVSTFIDEVTRSKILFHAGTDWHVPGGLADYIHEEKIPDFLGGPCQTNLSEGGLIPKLFYMTDEEHFDRERTDSPSLCENAIYRCVTLCKSQVHEVVIHNEDIGSVLCWDFDVMKQDVAFTVLRTRNPVAKALSGATEIVPAMESVVDRSWKKGVDYFVEEETLVSQDGESVQGSHVTTEAGTYVLQWRVSDLPHSMHRMDLIDSLTGLKAKIMYFYEVLSSDHYRGSMSSLLSAQSGFSSLSQQTLSDQSIASR